MTCQKKKYCFFLIMLIILILRKAKALNLTDHKSIRNLYTIIEVIKIWSNIKYMHPQIGMNENWKRQLLKKLGYENYNGSNSNLHGIIAFFGILNLNLVITLAQNSFFTSKHSFIVHTVQGIVCVSEPFFEVHHTLHES